MGKKSSKTTVYVAILPLTRFGYPTRDGQSIELEENEQTQEMIELGYLRVEKSGEDIEAYSVEEV